MTSLYRRHRPQTLAEVVGQKHIVRTLRNAIEQDRTHHAYLFVGSRGTGKTSIAKILARSLNCEQGPTVDPCGKCPSCRSIADGSSIDVIEMDAASHNSVEDIRELREKVGFVPAEGRWKVYILDEAHMLSTAAWNAFLKTLEEPPPRTIFVLATTEAHKVMATIVDRCQRFDFRRPSLDEIGEVLRRVATAEGIEISEEALGMVARSATGSFRDAISTLEQLVTYGGKKIASDDVAAALGIADSEYLFDVVDAIAASDPKAVLEAIDRLVATATEITQFINDLSLHLRQLLVTGAVGDVPQAFGLSAEAVERIRSQSKRLASQRLLRTADLLTGAYRAIREGADSRIQLELALLKAADPSMDGSSEALLERVERVEQMLAGQRPQPEVKRDRPETASQRPQSGGQKRERGSSELSLTDVIEAWPALLKRLAGRDEGQLLAALLTDAKPAKVEGSRVTVAFPLASEFQKRKAESKQNRKLLERELNEALGIDSACVFELSEDLDAGGAGAEGGLSEEEVVELLKREFDAEEITDREGVS